MANNNFQVWAAQVVAAMAEQKFLADLSSVTVDTENQAVVITKEIHTVNGKPGVIYNGIYGDAYNSGEKLQRRIRWILYVMTYLTKWTSIPTITGSEIVKNGKIHRMATVHFPQG